MLWGKLCSLFPGQRTPAFTALWRLRQEDFKFKASLWYVGKPCQRKTDMKKMGRGKGGSGGEGRWRRGGKSPNISVIGASTGVSSEHLGMILFICPDEITTLPGKLLAFPRIRKPRSGDTFYPPDNQYDISIYTVLCECLHRNEPFWAFLWLDSQSLGILTIPFVPQETKKGLADLLRLLGFP